jgi:hypothetical protein
MFLQDKNLITSTKPNFEGFLPVQLKNKEYKPDKLKFQQLVLKQN